MSAILLILLAITIVETLQIQESFACECEANRNYTDIVDNSDLVFIGTVNKIIVNGENSEVFVTFDVHSIAKSELAHSQVTTSTLLTDCSVDYEMDITYVVVIHEQESLSTDKCSTVPLSFMGHFENVPYSLLSAMTEPEVPNVKKLAHPFTNEEFTDEQICRVGNVLVDGTCLTPEPPILEPYYESPDYEPSCGLGTTYQDGICIANKPEEKENTDSSEKWGGFEQEIPLSVLDCDVDQIYNKETRTCDVRLNSTEILIPAMILVLISCFAVFLIWRKRK